MRTRTSGGVAGGAREGVPYADHLDVVGRVQSVLGWLSARLRPVTS